MHDLLCLSKYRAGDILYIDIGYYGFMYAVCMHASLFVLMTSQNTLHTTEGNSPLSPEKRLILHFHINEQIC